MAIVINDPISLTYRKSWLFRMQNQKQPEEWENPGMLLLSGNPQKHYNSLLCRHIIKTEISETLNYFVLYRSMHQR